MQISALQTFLQIAQKGSMKNLPNFPDSTSLSNAATSATADTPQKEVNFASMSRNDLRSWINEQLKAGRISHDDAWSLAFMTMNIPVDGSSMGDNMDKPVNFLEMARGGLQGAHQRSDKTTEEMLDSVLKVMSKR